LSSICPYCRTEIGSAEGEGMECPGCGAPHHSDCFLENGGCTVFGCSAGPTDEPKISVSATDMSGNVITRTISAPAPRPVLSLGAGYTTFHAPGPDPVAASSAPASAEPPAATPPPPPPMSGTFVAPPPMRAAPSVATPASLANYYDYDRPKSRVVFVLLGIFLGIFGVHNFYAGYFKKGVIQLCLTLMTCFYAALVSWVWAIVEICVVDKDMDDVQFT
jgi:TM2 domain-containing membrane protein YozV